MSYNQKMLIGITLIAALITAAVAFVLFDPPYSTNFKVEVAFIIFSQVLAGLTLVAKFGKKDSVFPFSIGVLPINLVYVAFTLIMALFTNCETRTFVMWHGVGFVVTVIAGIVFKMGEHHIEEQSKDDPPAQKIERSDVTWR